MGKSWRLAGAGPQRATPLGSRLQPQELAGVLVKHVPGLGLGRGPRTCTVTGTSVSSHGGAPSGTSGRSAVWLSDRGGMEAGEREGESVTVVRGPVWTGAES